MLSSEKQFFGSYNSLSRIWMQNHQIELVEPRWLQDQLHNVIKLHIRMCQTLSDQRGILDDSNIYDLELLKGYAHENLKQAFDFYEAGMAKNCVTYLTKTIHNLNMLQQGMGLSLQEVWKQMSNQCTAKAH